MWDRLSSVGRHAVEVAERYADGELNGNALAEARPRSSRRSDAVDNAAHFAALPNRDLTQWIRQVFRSAARAVGKPSHWRYHAELGVQAQLVREVFGQLRYRPVAIQPGWLTETVVSLSAGIYAERAFDRMPILADALEEAGCETPTS